MAKILLVLNRRERKVYHFEWSAFINKCALYVTSDPRDQKMVDRFGKDIGDFSSRARLFFNSPQIRSLIQTRGALSGMESPLISSDIKMNRREREIFTDWKSIFHGIEIQFPNWRAVYEPDTVEKIADSDFLHFLRRSLKQLMKRLSHKNTSRRIWLTPVIGFRNRGSLMHRKHALFALYFLWSIC